MDPALEIRKVPIAKITELAQILDSGESWKTLMAKIPKSLDSKHFVPKYGIHEMNLIESASKTRGSCTQILFEEWGTSGMKRPTLSSLLGLLIECELFRAADFVSIKLLNGSSVKRPTEGPGAAVDISIDKLRLEQSIKNMRMDSLLDGMSYPHLDTISSNTSTFDKNLDNKPTKVIDERKFVIPGLSNSLNISVEEAVDKSNSISDMIQFSSNTIASSDQDIGEIPAFSQLLLTKDDDKPESVANVSQSSSIVYNNLDLRQSNVKSEANIPNLSVIMNSSNGGDDYSEANIPNLSKIQNNTDSMMSQSSNIPDFGALQISGPQIHSYASESLSQYSDTNIPIISDLQQNNDPFFRTTLPHFTYEQLSQVTNNFEDKRIFDDSNKLLSGKIGEGGFGSVYLSRKLMEVPVAIKKLTLDYSLTGCEINEDLLKKQFKVEIEMLEKCKHENILVLLGYSYDGVNHCLVSEYMERGSLRENLNNNKTLTPLVRLNIAMGTARAIEFLHYHFEAPLIHRDIKSANILLTNDFTPKISDFGLVKDRSSNHTVQTTKVVGTTAYMSPEAFRGDVSVKMDVFSFGVVLLELLTSLPTLDENRAGKDIVTHVEDVCVDGSIEPLLDRSVGEWKWADELYEITKECLEEKRKRPVIKVVYEKLCKLANA